MLQYELFSALQAYVIHPAMDWIFIYICDKLYLFWRIPGLKCFLGLNSCHLFPKVLEKCSVELL